MTRGSIETAGCGLGSEDFSTLVLSVQSSWTCGGPAREHVPGHGMPAADGSSAQVRTSCQALRVGHGLSLLILYCAKRGSGAARNTCDNMRLLFGTWILSERAYSMALGRISRYLQGLSWNVGPGKMHKIYLVPESCYVIGQIDEVPAVNESGPSIPNNRHWPGLHVCTSNKLNSPGYGRFHAPLSRRNLEAVMSKALPSSTHHRSNFRINKTYRRSIFYILEVPSHSLLTATAKGYLPVRGC